MTWRCRHLVQVKTIFVTNGLILPTRTTVPRIPTSFPDEKISKEILQAQLILPIEFAFKDLSGVSGEKFCSLTWIYGGVGSTVCANMPSKG